MSSGPARRAVTTVRVLRARRRPGARRARQARHRGADGDPAPRSRPGARGAGRHHAHARATTSSSRSGSASPRGCSDSADDLDTVAYCLAGAGGAGVQRRHGQGARARSTSPATPRTFVANASCGLCGKTTLDEVEQQVRAGGRRARCVARSVLASLPERLRAAQRVFDATGGLHAAALFTADGELVALREDVGRHNALDKLVGHAAARAASSRSPTTCSWSRGG